MRLLLYPEDVPDHGPVDGAIHAWLLNLHRDDGPGTGALRPVHRLELLAEGRTAIDTVAGLLEWGRHGEWAAFHTGDCLQGRALVLRRYTFNTVPPACALPFFHPEETR